MPESSPLLALFTQEGLSLTTRCDGTETVRNVSDPLTEVREARESVVMCDLSPRMVLTLSGGDRLKFLHNFCTQDIKALSAGRGTEAFVTTIQGKVLAHVRIYADADRLWLLGSAIRDQELVKHLDRYILREDVRVESHTAAFGVLLVSGPQVSRVWKVLNAPVNGTAGQQVGEFFKCLVDGVDILACRAEWLTTNDWELVVPQDHLVSMWKRLQQGGVHPIGWETFSALRIAHGTPWEGVDITPEMLAPEVARTDRCISYRKGCYLGQEPIARIDTLGHVNRELRIVRFAAGSTVPTSGSPLFDQDQEVGVITSAGLLADANQPIALALVRRSHLQVGSQVRWTGTDTAQVGEVVAPSA